MIGMGRSWKDPGSKNRSKYLFFVSYFVHFFFIKILQRFKELIGDIYRNDYAPKTGWIVYIQREPNIFWEKDNFNIKC